MVDGDQSEELSGGKDDQLVMVMGINLRQMSLEMKNMNLGQMKNMMILEIEFGLDKVSISSSP